MSSSCINLLNVGQSNSDFMPYRLTAKCILVGDAGVGKSSILQRILGKEFNPNIFSTIGVEFGAKIIPLTNNEPSTTIRSLAGGPRAIKLQIWDAAGQERFRSIVQSYYRNSAVVILVFDLTNPHSLESLSFWVKEIETIRGIVKGWPLFYLLGNKSDLNSEQRAVFHEHIEAMTRKYPIRAYREVSAKNGEMIEDVLQEIGQDIDTLLPNQYHEEERFPIPGITFANWEINTAQGKSAGGKCC